MAEKTSNSNKTIKSHITVILDRTGSMEVIRDDTIGGFNTFLKQQKEEPGKATMTLVQFDTQDPYEVIHQMTPIKDVPELTRKTYVPRAATPLLDAMGRGINDLDSILAKMEKKEKPSRIVMVIITDGQENSSREFRKDQVEKMIREKTTEGWQFVFLSADLGAIDEAMATGVHAKSALAFDKDAQGTAAVWASASNKISAYRSGIKDEVSFDEEDRDKQKAEKKRKR